MSINRYRLVKDVPGINAGSVFIYNESTGKFHLDGVVQYLSFYPNVIYQENWFEPVHDEQTTKERLQIKDYHICRNGILRKYGSLVCSMCTGKEAINFFTSEEEFQKLQRRLKEGWSDDDMIEFADFVPLDESARELLKTFKEFKASKQSQQKEVLDFDGREEPFITQQKEEPIKFTTHRGLKTTSPHPGVGELYKKEETNGDWEILSIIRKNGEIVGGLNMSGKDTYLGARMARWQVDGIDICSVCSLPDKELLTLGDEITGGLYRGILKKFIVENGKMIVCFTPNGKSTEHDKYCGIEEIAKYEPPQPK